MNELAIIGIVVILVALVWVIGLIRAIPRDPAPSWAPDFADAEAALEQLTLEHEFVREIEDWLGGRVA